MRKVNENMITIIINPSFVSNFLSSHQFEFTHAKQKNIPMDSYRLKQKNVNITLKFHTFPVEFILI